MPKKNWSTTGAPPKSPSQEITALDPGNARAKSLRTLIHDKKQEEYVADALSRARELKESGNSDGALGVIDEALATYPKNPQLAQRRAVTFEAASRLRIASKRISRTWPTRSNCSKRRRRRGVRPASSTWHLRRDASARRPISKAPAFKTLLFDVKTRLEARARPAEPAKTIPTRSVRTSSTGRLATRV